ncbi:threonine synthase [Eudoraea chungangensis]|uniref:threonine synthase n=1 Tax=Eudoraea chungangensis TaxID=1481905 RepID=UPI0023EBE75C|nr:threonine synthase [Eudoraea chungangensis]
MKYYSLGGKAPEVSFKEAVINGLAPDKGLYFPETITPLPQDYWNNIENLEDQEIAFRAFLPFVEGSLSREELKRILIKVLDFPFPLIDLDKNTAILELFHGPTLAFKDVGARFMANCMGVFSKNNEEEVTVLVATSGDTGGAVANGFLGVPGVRVVILYPSGKVSDIQERQLTTLGKNIHALEVNGTFDDCQAMVKKAFLDTEITGKRKLTSANSINVARWLPQMFYYLLAFKSLKKRNMPLVFSVPSGNFGNICAGMVAHKLGMPVKQFIAATNSNNTVPTYLETQRYEPKKSVSTISNAMDVGDPSNFVRIDTLFENKFQLLKDSLSSYSYTDTETKNAIKEVNSKFNYIMDPHGAVGYLGLKKYQRDHPNTLGVFLETAHPVKFLQVVEETLKISIPLPSGIEELLLQKKTSKRINDYSELKAYLLED